MENFNWADLINPEFYINLELAGHKIGIYVVLFIIFAETGLFAGFFLPGDSLLFLAGIYSVDLMKEFVYIENDFLNVSALAGLVAFAGILGNCFGYWFGAKSGNYLYSKEDSFIFKKKYLIESQAFFDRHGGRAIIFARFLPVIRTFAPIIAGIVRMDFKRFMLFNILSSLLWAYSLILSGHYLYKYLLDKHGVDLTHYIEYIIIILVVLTTTPILMKAFKRKKVA
ncbi:VTT domain-containing protein [Myroides ceti]|uniref:VTT domain-containing protein n=2 Tax=Paenimyroides ceti TaxID=395087 RepID=A0ABT8CR95_9FLAO|nr:VTT domain-containing protein [Paenimyroides ceti]MDN3705742.1 VTT domain-containing protein [Paenimyroides ceti]